MKPALAVTIALKALLVGLLLLAVLRPDLPQFAGKAMTGRAIGYPIAAAIVPNELRNAYTDTLGDLALGTSALSSRQS